MIIHKRRKGIGLAGVLIAMVIIAVVAVAGFEIFVFVQRMMSEREARFIAVDIVHSQLEDLKEKARNRLFSDGLFSEGLHNAAADLVPVPSADFVLSYNVGGFDWTGASNPATPEYKVITVTCGYPTRAGNDNFTLSGVLVE